jgi:hypothetical protein
MNLLKMAVFVMGIISMSAVATCQSTPEAVVRAYCMLDGEGAAYSDHQPQTRAFDRLQVNAVEAAWDESTIIGSYRIEKVAKKKEGFEVVVLYKVLGTISSDLTLVSKPSDEKVTFNVIRVGGQWKVDHSEIGPHITKVRILTILSAEHSDAVQKARTSSDVAIREVMSKLEDALKQIRQW